MDVVCDKCQNKFNIPDKKLEKIPEGKVFTVPCPKCKNKISVRKEPADASPDKQPPVKAEKTAPPPEPPPSEPPPDDDDANGDDDASSGNPFDFLEEGTKTALLCEGDAAVRANIKAVLEKMEYHTSEPATHRDALKQMRFHDFDLVLLNERFGTRDPDVNHVLKHLEQLPMVTRRDMFIALISERFRTMDNMMAFNKSVNLIINAKDINNMEKVLRRGVNDNDAFYRVYKESLKKIKG
ncbi:hypothetical protein [Desulfonema magnum]|uniref:Zinc finger/thioredoxin putative domain-containing protein n=1 Tax=Desulfonema magnum TaxID=45655 RepID=A0A975GT05_9BACT|nr:hypothetical protein [Desulfonema magnum]QTA92610.1 Uncharacterized protein dnm_086970 [Desulfonema magnum]